MNILFVIGSCLKKNTSANLCHIAFVQGFIDAGHDVTVLSISEKNQLIDESIVLPTGCSYVFFDDSKILSLVKAKTRDNMYTEKQINNHSLKTTVYTSLKNLVLDSYGPFGHATAWLRNAKRKYHEQACFDLVISLSSPELSHYAAAQLIKNGNIKTKRFCEIWEDPWQHDIFNREVDPELLRLENEIVRYADKVLYVSPITLMYQKRFFPDCADKMDWIHLPCYYKDETIVNNTANIYGYFGNYFPQSRNLSPFYRAAINKKISVDICGLPYGLFSSLEKISITPRLNLNELKKHEDRANVLVFLCNLHGGQIPGKIYQYSATRKKILFILDGTQEEKKIIRDYFEKFNRYYFCENTEQSIEEVLDLIENGGDPRITDECIEYFSPVNTANQILDIVM